MKKTYILIPLFILFTACSQNVTEEDFLIGGTWLATAGYEDGEAEGKPNCRPLEEGLTFKDKDTVYNETLGRDIEYVLNETDEGSEIYVADPVTGGSYNYQIKKIGGDEITLEGLDYSISKGNSCYLERE